MKNEIFEKMMVQKPWGYEYLVFETPSMAMWCLHLHQNHMTSMHCHPEKKTGIIVISGEIEVSFLSDQKRYTALGKLMIRNGLFHSSKAISPGGAILLELETPVNKGNLVRLEDAYGRKGLPYENAEFMCSLSDGALVLPDMEEEKEKIIFFHGIEFKCLKTGNIRKLDDSDSSEIFAILDGGLISKTGDLILGPADVITPGIFRKLSSTFSSPYGITLIRMRKEV